MIQKVVNFSGDLEVVSGFDGTASERFEGSSVLNEFFEIFMRDHDPALVADVFFDIFVFVMFAMLLGWMNFGFYFHEYAVVASIASGADFFFEINPVDGLSDEVVVVVIKIDV